MTGKREIGKEVADNIIEEYGKGDSISTISVRHKVGVSSIRKVLSENGVSVREKGSCGYSLECTTAVSERFPESEGMRYVAVLKEDRSVRFNDYLNKSGSLSRYIADRFGAEVPSSYKRTKYLIENGRMWHEQWFDIVMVREEEVKRCPYCGWTTKDVENRSGWFLSHIRKAHGMGRDEYLSEHPEDEGYLSYANGSIQRQFEKDCDEYVVCAVCGKKLARIDASHLKKHSMTKEEYEGIYGGKTVSKAFHDKMAKLISKRNSELPENSEKYTSKGERELSEYIRGLGFDCSKNRKLLNGQELDIYIPEKRIAIEYDGLKWHTEWFGKKGRWYHHSKSEECAEKGVSLIHVFEDEYILKPGLVRSKIRHMLGTDSSLPKIQARKCQVRRIQPKDANVFLSENHIQGFAKATLHYGCFSGDMLVGVMSFSKESEGKWELTRFATDCGYVCCGIGGKLFSRFVKENGPEEVKTFLDRRWNFTGEGAVYGKLGFRADGTISPDYRYYNAKRRTERLHKFNFRKGRLSKRYGFPMSMTETEMARELGYDRIWDCGLIRFVWKKEFEG